MKIAFAGLMLSAACGGTIPFDVAATCTLKTGTPASGTLCETGVDLEKVPELQAHWSDDFTGLRLKSAEFSPSGDAATHVSGHVAFTIGGSSEVPVGDFSNVAGGGTATLGGGNADVDRFLLYRVSVSGAGFRSPKFIARMVVSSDAPLDTQLALTLHLEAER